MSRRPNDPPLPLGAVKQDEDDDETEWEDIPEDAVVTADTIYTTKPAPGFKPILPDEAYFQGVSQENVVDKPRFLSAHEVDQLDPRDKELYERTHKMVEKTAETFFDKPIRSFAEWTPLTKEEQQYFHKKTFLLDGEEPPKHLKRQKHHILKDPEREYEIPGMPLSWDPLYGGSVPTEIAEKIPLIHKPEAPVLKQDISKKLFRSYGRGRLKPKPHPGAHALSQEERDNLAPALLGNLYDEEFPVPEQFKSFQYEEELRRRRIDRLTQHARDKEAEKLKAKERRLAKENAKGTKDDFLARRAQPMSDAERARLYRRRATIRRLYAHGRDPDSVIRAHHYLTVLYPTTEKDKVERWVQLGVSHKEAQRRVARGIMAPLPPLPPFDREELERQMRSRRPRRLGEPLEPLDPELRAAKTAFKRFQGEIPEEIEMASGDDDGWDRYTAEVHKSDDWLLKQHEMSRRYLLDKTLDIEKRSIFQDRLRNNRNYPRRKGRLILPGEEKPELTKDEAKGIRIAHLTDLNFMHPTSIKPTLNNMFKSWGHFKRGIKHLQQVVLAELYDPVVREDIIAAIDEAKPDVIICTGNITAQGLEHEFDLAADGLATLMDKYPFFLVPGDHDIQQVDITKTQYIPLYKHFASFLHGVIPKWAQPSHRQRSTEGNDDGSTTEHDIGDEEWLKQLEKETENPWATIDPNDPVHIRPDGTYRDPSDLTRLLLTTRDNTLALDIQAQYPHLQLFLSHPFERLNQPQEAHGAMKLVNKVTNEQLRKVAKDSFRNLPPRQLVYTKDDVEGVNLRRRAINLKQRYGEQPPEFYAYGAWKDPEEDDNEVSKKQKEFLKTERVTQLDPRFFPTSPNNNQVLIIGLSPGRPAVLDGMDGQVGMYPREQLHELQQLLNNRKHIMNNQFAELSASEPVEETTMPFIILATHYPVIDRTGYDHAQVHPEDSVKNNHQLLHILDHAQVKPGLILHGHEAQGSATAITVQRNLHHNAMIDRLYPCSPPQVSMPRVPPNGYDTDAEHLYCDNTPEQDIWATLTFEEQIKNLFQQMQTSWKLLKYRLKLANDPQYFRNELMKSQTNERFTPRLSLLWEDVNNQNKKTNNNNDENNNKNKKLWFSAIVETSVFGGEEYDHDLNPYKPSSQCTFNDDIPALPAIFSRFQAWTPQIDEIITPLKSIYNDRTSEEVELGLTLDELQRGEVNLARDMLIATTEMLDLRVLLNKKDVAKLRKDQQDAIYTVEEQSANYCHTTPPLDVESYLTGTLQPFTTIRAPPIGNKNDRPSIRKRPPRNHGPSLLFHGKQFQRFSETASYNDAYQYSNNPLKSPGIFKRHIDYANNAKSTQNPFEFDDGEIDEALSHIKKQDIKSQRAVNVAGMHKFITQMLGATDYSASVHEDMLEDELVYQKIKLREELNRQHTYKQTATHTDKDEVNNNRRAKAHPAVSRYVTEMEKLDEEKNALLPQVAKVSTTWGEMRDTPEFALRLIERLEKEGQTVEDLRRRHNEAAEMISFIKYNQPRGVLPVHWAAHTGRKNLHEHIKQLKTGYPPEQEKIMDLFDFIDTHRRKIANYRFRNHSIKMIRKAYMSNFLQRDVKEAIEVMDRVLWPTLMENGVDRRVHEDVQFVEAFRNRKLVDDPDMVSQPMGTPMEKFQDLTPVWTVPNYRELSDGDPAYQKTRIQAAVDFHPFNIFEYQNLFLDHVQKQLEEQRWWDHYTLFKDGVTRPHPQSRLPGITITPNSLTEQHLDPKYSQALLPILDPENPDHIPALAQRWTEPLEWYNQVEKEAELASTLRHDVAGAMTLTKPLDFADTNIKTQEAFLFTDDEAAEEFRNNPQAYVQMQRLGEMDPLHSTVTSISKGMDAAIANTTPSTTTTDLHGAAAIRSVAMDKNVLNLESPLQPFKNKKPTSSEINAEGEIITATTAGGGGGTGGSTSRVSRTVGFDIELLTDDESMGQQQQQNANTSTTTTGAKLIEDIDRLPQLYKHNKSREERQKELELLRQKREKERSKLRIKQGPLTAKDDDDRLLGHLPHVFPGGIQLHRENYELVDTQRVFNNFQIIQSTNPVDPNVPLTQALEGMRVFINDKIFVPIRRGMLHHHQARAVLSAGQESVKIMGVKAIEQYQDEIEKMEKRKAFVIEQMKQGYEDDNDYIGQCEDAIDYYERCIEVIPKRVTQWNVALNRWLSLIDRVPSQVLLDRLKIDREEHLRQLYDEAFTLGVTLDILEKYLPTSPGVHITKQDSAIKLHDQKLQQRADQQLKEMYHTTPWLFQKQQMVHQWRLSALSQQEKANSIGSILKDIKPLLEEHIDELSDINIDDDGNNSGDNIYNDLLIEVENKIIDFEDSRMRYLKPGSKGHKAPTMRPYDSLYSTSNGDPLGLDGTMVNELIHELKQTIHKVKESTLNQQTQEKLGKRKFVKSGDNDGDNQNPADNNPITNNFMKMLDDINNDPNLSMQDKILKQLTMQERQDKLLKLLEQHKVLSGAYKQLPVIPLSQRADPRLANIAPPKVTIPIHNPGSAAVRRIRPLKADDKPYIAGFSLYLIIPRNELEQRLILAKTLFYKNQVKFPNNGNSYISSDYYSMEFQHYIHGGGGAGDIDGLNEGEVIVNDLPYSYPLF